MILLQNPTPRARAGTIFGYGFLSGLAITAGMMIAAGMRLRDGGTTVMRLLGLPVFRGTHSVGVEESVASLQPQWGVVVLVVVLPALLGGAAYVRARRTA